MTVDDTRVKTPVISGCVGLVGTLVSACTCTCTCRYSRIKLTFNIGLELLKFSILIIFTNAYLCFYVAFNF